MCIRDSHQLVDVSPADCDGQKAYGGEHGVTSAHIVRYDEFFITFLVCQVFERAPRLVGRCVDTLAGLVFAILVYQHFLKYAEGDRRLGCSAGL